MGKKETFIEKARKVHGDRYDYSEVDYVNSETKVCIICPQHGRFYQAPSAHIRGNHCPKCANIKRGDTFRFTKEDFLTKAREIHGDRYDYSKVDYKSANDKVCIVCSKHGEFWQTPLQHINMKQGCPKCAGRGLTKEEVIEKFREIHGDKYNYDKLVITKMNDKSIITCPKHGDFLQSPSKHLMGRGCPKCGKESSSEKKFLTKEEFVEKARKVHGDKYDYSKVDYKGKFERVEIICPKHGSFYQLPFDHLDGHGCQKCGVIVSNCENEIYDFLCNMLGKDSVIQHDRKVLGNGQEIDIYIPSLKFGIEYNGLYFHSDAVGKPRNYHLAKTEKCKELGIKLIQIFEDEYKANSGLILEKICYSLGLNENNIKVMARKTEVREIDRSTAKEFLNNYHIQGYSNATCSYGCFYNNKLVAVMSFSKTGEKDVWLLTRYATKSGHLCQGCAGKLFTNFVREHNPMLVKSFADRRWTVSSDNNLYTKLGFVLVDVLKPDYRYIKEKSPSERIHKFNLRKKSLHRKYGLNMDLTESQMVKELGYVKIWDCGLFKYVWKKKTTE